MRRLLALTAISIVVAAGIAASAADEKKKAAPELPTVMCKRGDLLLEETFTEDTWSKWNRYKGEWVVDKGKVKVAEIPTDKHHPAAQHKLECTNAIFQFSFKLDGAGWLGLALDDKEHVARIIIRPDGFEILKMSGIGGTTKGVKVDGKKVKFVPGQWYTAVFEVNGNEMSAIIGNQIVAYGETTGLDVAKTRMEFISGGKYAWFGDLRVWKAEPDKNWPARKQALASRKK